MSQGQTALRLSDEQARMIDAAVSGRNVIVDATVGSGKTTAIQQLCNVIGTRKNVLYLTYSKLLKIDAQQRVRGARKVQNYHGIVYPSLVRAGIRCGINDSIRLFNENFERLAPEFPRYDAIVVDEYQDISSEYAELLQNIQSLNPAMQVVMVGDMEQKVQSHTTLDASRFAREFATDAVMLPFTQSFRMGPEMGAALSEAWNKPVRGVNETQQVLYLDDYEVDDFLAEQDPKDLLCLGRRNGPMSNTLNFLEREYSEKFNKHTVFASIKDGDSSVTYGDKTAVFTTFDSSKGLERPISVVFDYDVGTWEMRKGMPNTDPEILRNVFLVAASRGKQQVVFVQPSDGGRRRKGSIGYIPVKEFHDLKKAAPKYDRPFFASQAFDFTYAENVQSCIDLLDRRRLGVKDGTVIDIDRTDGLIDLSPAVGHYQEALFFTKYNAKDEFFRRESPLTQFLQTKLSDNPWDNALILTAIETDQLRYNLQVDRQIPREVTDMLSSRLAELLPRDASVQREMLLSGHAVSTSGNRTKLEIAGVADVVYRDTVFELKYTTELSKEMFLQLGLYIAISGLPQGVLWNTRTNERWLVKVPDVKTFLNAVITCITKQDYRAFVRAA